MRIYYPITVDLINKNDLPVITAVQGNIGRGALISLIGPGRVEIVPDESETITLYGTKPDGTVSYLPCSLDGNQIKVDFTSQLLAVPGEVKVSLRMTAGAGAQFTDIATPIFIMRVLPSNVDDAALESTDEFTALQQALAEMTQLSEPATAAKLGVVKPDGTTIVAAADGTISVGTIGEQHIDFLSVNGEGALCLTFKE